MSDEKKIIIDEDWKSQVAAEKEAAQQQKQAASGESASAGVSDGDYEAIPASFDLLVSTFVTEAMVALGQLPHPATNQLAFDPAHARFAIDMLEVIAEKTKGNLTPQEDRGLQDLVHQLRMAFVAISSQPSAVSQNNIETP
ncbi:MAG TPA: DUF1844 domain-containing protein [Lacipirellula sp.]